MAEFKPRPRPDWHLECKGPMYLVFGSFTSCLDYEFYESFAVAFTEKPNKAARKAYIPKAVAREIRAAVSKLSNPELYRLEFKAVDGRAVWETWRIVTHGPPCRSKPVAGRDIDI